MTAKVIGYLTQCKQVEFKLFQDAIAKTFRFINYSHLCFNIYIPHIDQWTDHVIPLILAHSQPVLVHCNGVHKMAGFANLT